jgi:hypothetical protein
VIKSRYVKWAVHVTNTGQMRNAYKILFVNSEGNRLLGRHRYAWEDNIKTGLK